ncbi:GPR1/FUN34/yaaH family-domain-containing protein [Favolaschia claudopus]|uniref:GPR1/FUN34/yaaH family-domain-containing protein n=1 Tax=Favolaschia claudopus TaxID=2862362 RepID=A0AAW0D680_9AGAR
MASNGSVKRASQTSSIATASPLGILCFSSTTLIFSVVNMFLFGIRHPHIVVGMAIGAGGLVELLAGMWEFARGNAFGGTILASYSAFWLSFAAILIPGTGIAAGYEGNMEELFAALGVYLAPWCVLTYIFMDISWRRGDKLYAAMFASLLCTYGLATAGKFVEFMTGIMMTAVGGGFGVVTSIIGFYIGYKELLAADQVAIHPKRD